MHQPRRNEYSQTKVFHHFDRLEHLRRGEYARVVPVSAELDVTNACPHRCFYCYQFISKSIGLNWALHNPQEVTDFSRASELLHEMAEAGVRAIEYCGRGEPFAYDRFPELLQITRKAGLQAGVINSGCMLDEEKAYAVAEAEPVWVRFSIDSLQDGPFNTIRRPETEEVGCSKVTENIERFCAVMAEKDGQTRISASTVLLPQNHREVCDLARFSKACRMKAHVFRLVNMKNRDRLYKDIWAKLQAELRRAQDELQDDDFDVYLPPTDFYLNRTKPFQRCYFSLFDVAIDVNFNVYGCLENIFNPRFLIGNVGPDAMSFRELLSSPRRREMLDMAVRCPACCRDEVNCLLEGFAHAIHPDFV